LTTQKEDDRLDHDTFLSANSTLVEMGRKKNHSRDETTHNIPQGNGFDKLLNQSQSSSVESHAVTPNSSLLEDSEVSTTKLSTFHTGVAPSTHPTTSEEHLGHLGVKNEKVEPPAEDSRLLPGVHGLEEARDPEEYYGIVPERTFPDFDDSSPSSSPRAHISHDMSGHGNASSEDHKETDDNVGRHSIAADVSLHKDKTPEDVERNHTMSKDGAGADKEPEWNHTSTSAGRDDQEEIGTSTLSSTVRGNKTNQEVDERVQGPAGKLSVVKDGLSHQERLNC
jgi:hypothetical protein